MHLTNLLLELIEEETKRVKYSSFNGRTESQLRDFQEAKEQRLKELHHAKEVINALN